jgi:hypothetical protein
MRRRFAGERLWSNRIKMFMDGVVESSTALRLAPYPGLETCGEAVFEPEHFTEAYIRADALGFQISVHAIGDLAIRRTLDGYAAAMRANGRAGQGFLPTAEPGDGSVATCGAPFARLSRLVARAMI